MYVQISNLFPPLQWSGIVTNWYSDFAGLQFKVQTSGKIRDHFEVSPGRCRTWSQWLCQWITMFIQTIIVFVIFRQPWSWTQVSRMSPILLDDGKNNEELSTAVMKIIMYCRVLYRIFCQRGEIIACSNILKLGWSGGMFPQENFGNLQPLKLLLVATFTAKRLIFG